MLPPNQPHPPSNKVKDAAYGLKAEAADGIYINNVKDKGDLYIDSVISHTGDVKLTTKGSFIDNNDSDIFDETAAEKLLRWGHGQILAGVESTAKLQKEMLITKAQNKYNRYQLLSKMANENDEIVLSDLEVDAIKRTLYEQDRKEETNKYINNDEAVTNFINEYIADLQKEYERKGFHLQRLYKRRKADNKGIMRSTFDSIMSGSVR